MSIIALSGLDALSLSELGAPAPTLRGDCNTPINSPNGLDLNAHLDYLSGSIPPCKKSDIFSLASLFSFGRPIKDCPKEGIAVSGCYFLNSVAVFPGVSIGYQVCTDFDDDYFEVRFSLSGSYFESIKSNQHIQLLHQLALKFSPKITRIDIAIDDYSHSVIPLKSMLRADSSGKNSGYHNYKLVSSRVRGSNRSSIVRDTHYFGSRSSKLVRVYQHDFSDDTNCLRFEVEFHSSRANYIFQALSSISLYNILVPSSTLSGEGELIYQTISGNTDLSLIFESFQRCLFAFALGAIDFRVSSGSRKDRKRSSRCRFWSDFLRFCSSVPVRCPLPKISKTLSSTVNWLFRQVSTTLAAFHDCLDSSQFSIFFQDLLTFGRHHLTFRHTSIFDSLDSHYSPDFLQLQNSDFAFPN